jgi:hypothetical protein
MGAPIPQNEHHRLPPAVARNDRRHALPGIADNGGQRGLCIAKLYFVHTNPQRDHSGHINGQNPRS